MSVFVSCFVIIKKEQQQNQQQRFTGAVGAAKNCGEYIATDEIAGNHGDHGDRPAGVMGEDGVVLHRARDGHRGRGRGHRLPVRPAGRGGRDEGQGAGADLRRAGRRDRYGS